MDNMDNMDNNVFSIRNYLISILNNDLSFRNMINFGNFEMSNNNFGNFEMSNNDHIEVDFYQPRNSLNLMSFILQQGNNYDSLNNFINSTLNEKPSYKNIASDEGLQQVEEIIYSNDLSVNNTCPIFFTNFQEGQIISRMPCNHCFDSLGLNTWLKESNVCPVCRFELDYKEN